MKKDLTWDLLKGFVTIDLYNVKPENIKRLLEDNGLYKKSPNTTPWVDPEKLAQRKAEGVQRIWIDRVTCETVAAIYTQNPTQIVFDVYFLKGLYSLKPIKFNGSQPTKVKVINIEPLTMDQILDKINESGVDSLTKKEKEFLDGIK